MTDARDAGTPPLDWPDVLAAEYRALYGEPALTPETTGDDRLKQVHRKLHERGPTALCLSGGGIRSATFALGVLQGLAHFGVLSRFSYLSTVSGGGYIGGWLTTWLKREHPDHAGVVRALDPALGAERNGGEEAGPVAHVRRTCRYLAPQGGVVSADMWTVFATMGRNLLLNWLIILPLLAAALLVPRLYYATVSAVEANIEPGACAGMSALSASFLVAALAGFTVATAYIVLSFAGPGGRWSQNRFVGLFLVPLLAGAIFITLFWSAYSCALNPGWTMAASAGLPALAWLIFGAIGRWRTRRDHDGRDLRIRVGPRTVFAALAAGPILGAGSYWFAMFTFSGTERLGEAYAVLAVPIVLGLVILTITLFVGLASSTLEDAALEWWSRCSAWIGIAAMLWVVVSGLVFYMADALQAGLESIDAALQLESRVTSATIFAAIVPLLSSLAGLLARPSSGPERAKPASAIAQRLALPVVITALLCSIAWVNLRLIERLEYHWENELRTRKCDASNVAVGSCHPLGAGVGEVLILGLGLAAFGLAMSWFVPTNRFSLHGMYRQRLVRTFLGASRRDRAPTVFTGFDRRDDIKVHELADVRPLHVINATLNAVSSTHVGRHERQAESFTFTPLHVGNQSVKYRPASDYGSDGGGPGTGLSLGMALAVSGAAASSSLGIYSSKARAFLLTLANARLGLWFGNPASETTWQQSDPPLGVGPLMRELLGLTTDDNPYVYLSDGGHYENLGMWEMVARRCRLIVVSDAGCDPNYSFDDLSNAVRRIRLDLGIPIQFPPMTCTRDGQGRGNPHGAIGIVRYSAVDGPEAPDGTILYLKATLSGDEPVDVWNFARTNAAFPHDATGDQFFDEARFESYRTLGFHTVLSVARGVKLGGLDELVEIARRNLSAGTPDSTGERSLLFT